MKKIARLVFKIHRYLYGYPMRSEVRLVLNKKQLYNYSLREVIGMLYICHSSIEEVSEWVNVSKEVVIKELNLLVKGLKL